MLFRQSTTAKFLITGKRSYETSPKAMATSEIAALNLARKIFIQGVEAVVPSRLVRNQVKLNGKVLSIQKVTVNLKQFRNSYIVGFGKAVLPMAEELLSIIGTKAVKRCVLSVPEGSSRPINPNIEMYQGAKNNAPDSSAFEATLKIVDVVKSCSSEDLLIVLISGGGSALLPYPKPPITLQEKTMLFKQLSSAGATINELNAVRKVISVVKGGGLARLCNAKQIISLILSDVLDDRLDVIASGPTVQNTDDKSVALQVVSNYIPENQLAPSIKKALLQQDEISFQLNKNIENILLGSNAVALEACANQAVKEDMLPMIVTSNFNGTARDVGKNVAKMCQLISVLLNDRDKSEQMKLKLKEATESFHVKLNTVDVLFESIELSKKEKKKLCLLFGGETTVNVKGKGLGGRNQELALAALLELGIYKTPSKVTILSAGTDGIDGPCTAAGATINSMTLSKAKSEGLDPKKFLEDNDSFNFFSLLSNGLYHIVTGHTGTNVMDVIVAIIEQSTNASSL